MADLPSLSGKKAVRAFERLGFVQGRQSSSHVIMKRAGHRWNLSVPVHGSKDLPIGTLRGLIKSAGVTEEEFIAHL